MQLSSAWIITPNGPTHNVIYSSLYLEMCRLRAKSLNQGKYIQYTKPLDLDAQLDCLIVVLP